MLVFVIKKLANAALVMLAVSFLAFLIFQLAGDPVDMMSTEQSTQADRDALREKLGLNDNFLVQYTRFVANAAQGNFGISYRNGQEVLGLIAERFPATMELVLVATVLSLLIGLPLGVLTAIKRGAWYSEALQFGSIIGVSLPSFVVGILLILVFSVTLGWLPAFGRGQVVDLGWWSTGFLTKTGLLALILPSISLSLYQVTLIMRLVRAEMLEVMRSDYVKFARARGIPRHRRPSAAAVHGAGGRAARGHAPPGRWVARVSCGPVTRTSTPPCRCADARGDCRHSRGETWHTETSRTSTSR